MAEEKKSKSFAEYLSDGFKPTAERYRKAKKAKYKKHKPRKGALGSRNTYNTEK